VEKVWSWRRSGLAWASTPSSRHWLLPNWAGTRDRDGKAISQMCEACQRRAVERHVLHGIVLTHPAGLNNLPVDPKTIRTPTGIDFNGVSFQGRICGVSIMRGEYSYTL